MLTMCLTACGDSSSVEDYVDMYQNDSSFIEYKEKSLLKTANKNAKEVFTTTKNNIEDFIADNKAFEKLDYIGRIDEMPESDPLHAIIKKGIIGSFGVKGFYICIKFDPNSDSNFAQWSESESGTIVGQYPNPPESYDEATKITLGKKA